MKNIKNEYDYIIIEISKNNDKNINKEILKNSDLNFIITEENLLGIKEIKKLLDVYFKEWNLNKRKFNFILNKKNFNSINKNLVSKIIQYKIKKIEIKENKYYFNLINNYFKNKYLLKNKKLKKEINKILLKLKN